MTLTRTITTEDLPAVGAFLSENLNSRVSAEQWAGQLNHDWAEVVPNFGFMIEDDGKLVGVLCAYYSDQDIDGRRERFCNPHSWCVLEPHRKKSIDLVLRALRQDGYHFTMLSPNAEVAKVFRYLKFRELDNRFWTAPNIPGLHFTKTSIWTKPEDIAVRLDGSSRRTFELHRHFAWLDHIAIGDSQGLVHVVYKRRRFKRLPCARILYASDPVTFERLFRRLSHHWLLVEGIAWTSAECRLLRSPRGAFLGSSAQAKLILSDTLDDSRVQNLFSELVALDI